MLPNTDSTNPFYNYKLANYLSQIDNYHAALPGFEAAATNVGVSRGQNVFSLKMDSSVDIDFYELRKRVLTDNLAVYEATAEQMKQVATILEHK